jgi:hypothetical protein
MFNNMFKNKSNNKLLFIKPILFILIILILFIELIKIPFPKLLNITNSNLENFHNNNNNNKINKDNINIHNINIHNNNIKLEQEMEFKKNELNVLSSKDSKDIFYNNSYLNSMNDINIKARGFTNLEEIVQKYKNESIQDITDEEQNALFWFIQNLIIKADKLSPFIYNQLFNKNVMIAKSNPWLEHNMPHTHKNVIILTQNWFDGIVKKEKDNLVMSALNNEGSTFIHELLHVHQRFNIKKYNKLYYKLGFVKPKYIHNSHNFIMKNRCNPDGNDLSWVWNYKKNNTYYMIGAIYKNNNPTNIVDVSYISREITRSDKNIFNYSNIKEDVPLYNNDAFREYFNIFNNHYHPNEIASQYMEFYFNKILDNNDDDDDDDNSQGYKIFNKEIDKILYGKQINIKKNKLL